LVIGRTRDNIEGAATLIGKCAESAYFDKKVWLDVQGAHAIYVVGKRRSGKTHTLGALCEGLCSGGWITQMRDRQAVLLFDTMNVFLTINRPRNSAADSASEDGLWELPNEVPSVQLFRPAGTPTIQGTTVPEIHLGGHDLTAEEWLQTLGVDQFTDVLGHLIFDAYERVRYSGYTTTSNRVEPMATFGLAELERCVGQAQELSNFRDETRQAAIRRFRALSRNSIFSDTGLDLGNLLVPGRTSVLLLRDLPSETRELFVSVLVRRIVEGRSSTEHYERLLAAASAEARVNAGTWIKHASEGIPRCWILIDEAHNYIPNDRSAISKRPLKRLIDEGRNLGISIVAATQQPSGLDGSIRRNADLLFIHSMSMEDDIRAAAGMLTGPWPKNASVLKGGGRSSVDFFQAVRSLPRGYALVSSETLPRVMGVRVRPRLTESGDKGY
jgi:hypothetical protein